MSILNKTLPSALALMVVAGSFGQIVKTGNKNTAGSSGVNGGVSAQACKESNTVQVDLPNLIWDDATTVKDPWTGQNVHAFRPEEINLDGFTVRDVLTITGADLNCSGTTVIVQAVAVEKETPYIKCTAFVYGPGSGENTNFRTGYKFATNQNLDDSVVNLSFGIPKDDEGLGDRCLLFSPPNTKYTLKVVYVRRDDATGRVGAPIVAMFCVRVKVPTRDDIRCNIEYFSTVAAGVTQKCKITNDCAEALFEALSLPDNLDALIAFETVVALCAIDFSVLRDAKNAKGNYDARFIGHYLIDSDEEPIGCLLIEQANAALWF